MNPQYQQSRLTFINYIPRQLPYAEYRININQLPRQLKVLPIDLQEYSLIAIFEPKIKISLDLSPFSPAAHPAHYAPLALSLKLLPVLPDLNSGYTQDTISPLIHFQPTYDKEREKWVGEATISAVTTDLYPGKYRLNLQLIDIDILRDEENLEYATLATKTSEEFELIVKGW